MVLGTLFWVLAPLLIYMVSPPTWLILEGYVLQPWFRFVEAMISLMALIPINAILIGMARTTPAS